MVYLPRLIKVANTKIRLTSLDLHSIIANNGSLLLPLFSLNKNHIKQQEFFVSCLFLICFKSN
jgi:hypothetical protein